MHYQDLKNLLALLPAFDHKLPGDGEVIDCAYVRNAITRIIGSHHDNEEISQDSINQLVELLKKRFKYIEYSHLFYTENTVSCVNRFCIELATELQKFTGKNRFQLLMPTILSTKCATGLDLDDPNVSVTDFILDSRHSHIIDVKQCLKEAEVDTLLRHNQRNRDKNKPGILLRDATKKRLLEHTDEGRYYYDAIVKLHEFEHDSKNQEFIKNYNNSQVEDRERDHQSTYAYLRGNVAKLRERFLQKLERLRKGEDKLAAKDWNSNWFLNLDDVLKKFADEDLQKLANELSTKVKMVSSRYNRTTLVTDNDDIYVCGRHGDDAYHPGIPFRGPAHLSGKVTHVASSYIHSAVVTDNNKLHVIGQNDLNVMGCKTNYDVWQKWTAVPGINEPIKTIATCDFNTIVLFESGKMIGCGYNSDGRLGLAGNHDSVDKFTEMKGVNEKFTQISIGRTHALLLTESGDLYINGVDVLARRQEIKNVLPHYFTKLDGFDGKITQIGAGDLTSYVLTDKNKLYVRGNNEDGQLGLGDFDDRAQFVEVEKIPGKIAKLIPGKQNLMLLLESGELYGCGSNFCSQLGWYCQSELNHLTRIGVNHPRLYQSVQDNLAVRTEAQLANKPEQRSNVSGFTMFSEQKTMPVTGMVTTTSVVETVADTTPVFGK